MLLYVPVTIIAILAVSAEASTSCCTNCVQNCNPDGTETNENGQFITFQPPFPPGQPCECTCKTNWESSDPANKICDQFIPCAHNPPPNPPCDSSGGSLGPNGDDTACVCNCNEGYSGADCSMSCLPPDGYCVGFLGQLGCLVSRHNYIDASAEDSCPDHQKCCRPKRDCDQAGESCKPKKKCKKQGGTVQADAKCHFPKVCCLAAAP